MKVVVGSKNPVKSKAIGNILKRDYLFPVIEEVLNGKEVVEVMDNFTGIDNLGKKTGAVNYLSKGMLDQVGNTGQCVLMAMIPWLNGELYNIAK